MDHLLLQGEEDEAALGLLGGRAVHTRCRDSGVGGSGGRSGGGGGHQRSGS